MITTQIVFSSMPGARVIFVAFALLCMDNITAVAQGGWVLDTKTGCKIWNPNPQPNESVQWSGDCVNGLAHGRGAAQWMKDNAIVEKDEGEWREGRQVGRAVQVWATGRYEGDVVDGLPHGYGVLLWNGFRYEGEFRNGKPNGRGTLTNFSGVFQGMWKDGCLRDRKRKVSVGVPVSTCP